MKYTKSQLQEEIKKTIIEILSEQTPESAKETADELERAVEAAKELKNALSEEDEEPTLSDLKQNDSLAVLAGELATVTKQMKSLAKQYKVAGEEEKQSIINRLKELTKIKKEIESLIY